MYYKLVKIGAHKGGDIHSNISSTDRCIFVEPVKEIYEVLQTNLNRDYPNNNFVLLNKAVSDYNCKLTLYVPDIPLFNAQVEPWYIERELVMWVDQLTSVYKNHVRDHLLKVPVIQREVECVTLDYLIDIHQVSAIETLVTDTEGNDHRVLKGLSKVYPDNIVFENKHIEGTNKQLGNTYKSTIKRFKQMGYRVDMEDSEDTYLKRHCI